MKNEKERKWKEKMTLGWKPEKGSLEQKWENFWRLMGRTNRRMKGQRPDSIRSLYEVFHPFRNQNLNSSCLPSNSRVYHSRSWRLSNCHIQRLEKMNLFKMLDFQRILFSKKRVWKRATPFAQRNCENKSLEPDHQILSQCPFGDF